MAIKQPSKLRALTFILIGAVTVYFLLTFFTGRKPLVDSVKVKISRPPAISSIPGSVKDNARYKELQEKDNEKRAQQAKKTGQTNLPTLVNKTDQKTNEDDQVKDPKRPTDEKKPKEDALKKAQDDADRRLKEQQARLDKLKKEQEDKRKQSELARLETQKNQQGMKDLEAKIGVNLSEMAALTKAYAPPAKQAYVAAPASAATAKKDPAPSNIPPLYKAGTVIYGVIESEYNSDNPGPVMARITSGPLAGSRLIGTAAGGSDWSTGLNVSFNTMARPMAAKSQSINLRAVDPATLQPVVASTVNYHYGQRYGALLMSGALSQGSQQVQDSSSSSTGSSSTTSSTSSSSSSSSSGSSAVSLATPVATDVISNLNKVASRPATYKIEQGTAVGLLFVNDFILES